MSQCIHCDYLQSGLFGEFCRASSVIVTESINDITIKFKKLPYNTLNSDADTPTWCPRGLK
jgi:hypothetical protein